MLYQVTINLEVGNEAAAYDVVKNVVENAKCESFEIQNEEEVQRKQTIQDELIAHLKSSCRFEEDFEDALTACGFTEEEVKVIIAQKW